ncbi:MAG: tetratricopeptide repeat protein [Anaerolineales bacterium]
MTESQKTALKLVLIVLVGSLLGFSPTVHSVTQNAQAVESAFAAGQYLRGADDLLLVADANPWWTTLWEKAGEAYTLAGDYRMAVSAFQRARDLNDLSDNGLVDLGSAHLKLGEEQAAEEVWLSLPGSRAALGRLAALYEDQGEIDRAVEVWHDYLASSEKGGQPDEIMYFGLLIAADTPPKALAYLDQSAADYPEAGVVATAIREALDEEPAYELVNAGQALASINYWRLAAHAFEKAVTLRPDYPEAWIYWGEALQHLEDPPADPLETLEKGLSLDEDSPLANLFIGIYWGRKGSHETALEYFGSVETAWPDRADVLIEEGKSLAALGRLDEALGKYQAAVELYPEQPGYYRMLAEFTISYSYSLRELGLPAARLAVQLDDQDPANRDVLGQVLLALEDDLNAIKLFQQALELDPGYAPAFYHLGIIYSASGSRDQAVYYLQQAVAYSKNPSLTEQAQRLLSTY